MSRNQERDKATLIAQMRKTPIVQVACERSGVPRSTYYRWHREDEVFADAADQALDESASLINDMAESQLISAIKDKNLTAIIFWLKHHHKAYATRVEVNAKLQAVQEELTPEQSELVTKALQLAGLAGKEGEDNGGA